MLLSTFIVYIEFEIIMHTNRKIVKSHIIIFVDVVSSAAQKIVFKNQNLFLLFFFPGNEQRGYLNNLCANFSELINL